MKIINVFKKSIEEGMKAAALIEKPNDKAMAYAALAQAIATSGVLKRESLSEDMPKGKDSLRHGATKSKNNIPVQDPIQYDTEDTTEELEFEKEELQENPEVEEVIEEEVVEEAIEEPTIEEEEIVEEEIEEPVVEEVEEELVEEPVEEEVIEEEEMVEEEQEEITCEWTDQAREELAEEVEFFNNLLEQYDESSIIEILKEWSDNAYTKIDDITPLNIVGFVTYLKAEYSF